MSYRYHERLAAALAGLGWQSEGGADGTACAGRRQVIVYARNDGWSVVATWKDSTRIQVIVFMHRHEVAEVEVKRNPGRGWALRIANAAAEELAKHASDARVTVEDPDANVVYCWDCSMPYGTGARHTCPGPSAPWHQPNEPIPF